MEKIINHRLYLSGIPANNDRGIACYSKCLGAFLKCFGIATTCKCGSRVYFVNKRSLNKYHIPNFTSIPLPSRPGLNWENLPQAIQAIQEMSINKFKEVVEEKDFLWFLGAYDNKVQPLYMCLKQDRRVILIDALLRNGIFNAFRKIAEVWEPKEALSAYLSCKGDAVKLQSLCSLCNFNAFFHVILDAMTVDEFQKILKSDLFFNPKIIAPILEKDDAKGEAFLLAQPSVKKLAPYWNSCSPSLKGKWLDHLKSAKPENYFRQILDHNEERCLEFVKEFLESMTEVEVREFSKFDPFGFKNYWTAAFTYVISQLDSKRALSFLSGLWESEDPEMDFRVESLAVTYRTLKDPEHPEIYSDKLKDCLESVLSFFSSLAKEPSEMIIKFRDGLEGPKTQAFAALMTYAMILGIKNPKHRPFLITILESDVMALFFMGWKIFENPALLHELDSNQMEELKDLAASHSNTLKFMFYA